MNKLSFFDSARPCVIFLGDVDQPVYAKTGFGIVQWCGDQVAGQIRLEGNPLDLGVPDINLQQAIDAGAKSFVIGVAPVGGHLSDEWIGIIKEAAGFGLDIISGLHSQLEEISGLSVIADSTGAKLVNIRTPPENIPVGDGRKRSGQRVLMVGTDCAVGKKYTALALTKSLQQQQTKATFRATGQTGIMIAGAGISIDAVVSDFVSGAAELISPDNDSDHWDVIEGQGSLFNASYAGVSLGLLHGSQPDAIVVCHDAVRQSIISCPGYSVPSLAECIDLNLRCARLTNRNVYCAGISVNTSALTDAQREEYLGKLSSDLSLPCVDPVIHGCEVIARQLLNEPNGVGESRHA